MSVILPRQRNDIAKLIPHAGSMCLLEKVLDCDARLIRCETTTHRDRDNPLRNKTGLPVTAALEYAAQAAALQGGLQGPAGEVPRGGYLAVLSHIGWTVDRLDEIDMPLIIEVTREAEGEGGIECCFAVMADQHSLVQGSFVVAFPPL